MLDPFKKHGPKRKAKKKAKRKATKKKVAKKAIKKKVKRKPAKKKVTKKKATRKKATKKKVARKAAKKASRKPKKKAAKKKATRKRSRSKIESPWRMTLTEYRKAIRSEFGSTHPLTGEKITDAKIKRWHADSVAAHSRPKKKAKKATKKKAKKKAKRSRKKASGDYGGGIFAEYHGGRGAPSAGGVVVECVRAGGKIRVRPRSGQGYDASMNTQFPRHLRTEGCVYVVDDLELARNGTFYRAVGEIRPFEGGLGASAPASRPTPRRRRSSKTAKTEIPRLLLAKKWTDSCNPRGWWVSEKLDGVRAYWDGENFVSRQGNVFHAPPWFKEGLPDHPLDGELWIGRGLFNRTISVVRSQEGGPAWKKVRYLVFDVPEHDGPFEERLKLIKRIVKPAPYAHAVPHFQCKGEGHLVNELAEVEAQGGEGLMLRQAGSYYDPKRSSTLLKVKTFHDAEATVTGYYPGKGKHKGVIGGMYVETPEGIRFKLGTGLTDAERRDPPSIGSVVTYRYQELTPAGAPRFASFLRVRPNPDWAWRR